MRGAMTSPVGALDENSLRALRRTLRFVMLVESGQFAEPPAGMSTVSQAPFAAAVRRHRVASVLAPHLSMLDFTTGLSDELNELGARQRLHGLRLAGQTREVMSTLADSGVRAISLKGVCLATLTTGDFTARGGGDVDVLVDATELVPAMEALAAAGVVQSAGSFPDPTDGWPLRFGRWLTNEAHLERDRLAVDLHWWLNPVRGCVPDFDAVWSRREEVDVGGTRLATLSAPDALIHLSAHATKDEWRDLRGLVDLSRLLHRTGGIDTPSPPTASKVVGLSARVTDWAVGIPPRTLAPEVRSAAAHSAIAVARNAQALPDPRRTPQRWSLGRFATWQRHQLRQTTLPSDYLRAFVGTFVTAEDLCRTRSDSSVTVAGIAAARWRHVRGRLRIES